MYERKKDEFYSRYLILKANGNEIVCKEPFTDSNLLYENIQKHPFSFVESLETLMTDNITPFSFINSIQEDAKYLLLNLFSDSDHITIKPILQNLISKILRLNSHYFYDHKCCLDYICYNFIRYLKSTETERFIEFYILQNNSSVDFLIEYYRQNKKNCYSELTIKFQQIQDDFIKRDSQIWKKLIDSIQILLSDKSSPSIDFFIHCQLRKFSELENSYKNLNAAYFVNDNLDSYMNAYHCKKIFSDLDVLYNAITEYFCLLTDSFDIFSHLTKNQINNLFINSHSELYHIYNQCTSIPPLESVTKIFRYHLQSISNCGITTSNYASETTDDLYNDFLDAIEIFSHNTDDISEELAERQTQLLDRITKFYPPSMNDYLSAHIITVSTYESLIAYEFYSILLEGKIIRTCTLPNCNHLFITHKLNARYCKIHKQAKNRQQKYIKSNSPYFSLYTKYKLTYNKRKKSFSPLHMKESTFNEWNKQAQESLKAYEMLDISDENIKKFQDELNQISINLSIIPPRTYISKSK